MDAAPQRLFVLCGLPFAGKTTLARALVARFGWTLIRIDTINDERGLGLHGSAITPEQWSETYVMAFGRLGDALRRGETVVFDAVSFTVSQRDDVREIAGQHNVPTIVLYVTTGEAQARERWQRNRQERGRHDVRDEDFANVVDNFEPPIDRETTLRYDGASLPEEWLTQVFSRGKVGA